MIDVLAINSLLFTQDSEKLLTLSPKVIMCSNASHCQTIGTDRTRHQKEIGKRFERKNKANYINRGFESFDWPLIAFRCLSLPPILI